MYGDTKSEMHMLVNTDLNPLQRAVKKAYGYARTGNPEVTEAVRILKIGQGFTNGCNNV